MQESFYDNFCCLIVGKTIVVDGIIKRFSIMFLTVR